MPFKSPFEKTFNGIPSPFGRRLGVGQPFGVFTPADLFTGSETGVFYDVSDLSTLFQDSAGTTPVTVAGQPVGLMLEKSGNGNHAVQAIAAARPIYQTSPDRITVKKAIVPC